MSMSKISEFVTFLSNKNHSLEEILTHLVRVTLRDLHCDSLVLVELNDTNELVTVGVSGAGEDSVSELSDKYSLSENYPVCDAIKTGKNILLIEEEDFYEKYPLLSNFPHLIKGKSLLAVPISLSATPMAVFGITCERNPDLASYDLDFLTAIADIFALSVYAAREFSSVDRKVELDIPHLVANDSEDLTPRQVLISRLISEGRTNHDISELISYSESTTRQEIMKLFVLTNSKSRREVGEHYKRRHKES